MQVYSVNQSITSLSWISLIIWVLSASAFIILLAMGSSYWFFPMLGMVFLFQWGSTVSTYPKAVITSHEAIIFMMAGGTMIKTEYDQLKVDAKPSAYALEVKLDAVTRKLRLARKNLPDELALHLDSIAKYYPE